MSIRVENLVKRFGSQRVVDDVSFQIESGELVALLGPSGGGKSTVLRILAGLESADSGEIWLCGRCATHVRAQERGIGFVFQHYALFRHMTVRQNVAFGLEVRKASRAEIDRTVGEMLALVQLDGLGDRFPSQLSGGQCQRVALARALAPKPSLLLLDEPFGALDAKVRLDLRGRLRRLHEERAVTTVFVTHDQDEALDLADRVIVMQKGRVEQIGTPEAIYDHPETEFVAAFVGSITVLRGEVKEGRADLGALRARVPPGTGEGASVRAFIRPHDVDLTLSAPASRHTPTAPVVATGRVERMSRIGGLVKIDLCLGDGQRLAVELTKDRVGELAVSVGDQVFVNLRDAKIFVSDYEI